MTTNNAEQLSEVLSSAHVITDEVQTNFGGLSEQQLNWKPSEDQWSIAQCLDHLVTTNGAYFPAFDEILSGKKKNTFWEGLPWLPGLWGKLLIKSLDPASKRRLKAPTIFQPSSSKVDATIVRRFIDQQQQVISYLNATADLDLDKIKISSPVTKVITYSLMDTYRILFTHEKRHFLQALRVSKMDGFPKA
jgi:hypothetical protein